MNTEYRRIEVGDVVAVHHHGAQTTISREAVVRYIPQATGDSWVFTCNHSGKTIYISEGCTIERQDHLKEAVA